MHERSSRSEVLCKRGALKNFAKFTEKRLCQSLFFNKVTGLSPATLLKKKLWHRCFPVNFAKFLRTPFFYRTPPVIASDMTREPPKRKFYPPNYGLEQI